MANLFHTPSYQGSFVGRSTELDQLSLSYTGKTYNVFGIFGFKSIGKSSFVKKFLYDIQPDLHLIWWIHLDRLNIKRLYLGLLEELGVDTFPDEPEDQLFLIVERLKIRGQQIVIVLDNVDKIVEHQINLLEHVIQLVSIDNVTIFLTSILKIEFEFVNCWDITLEPLSEDEAIELLKVNSIETYSLDDNLLKRLVLNCGGFPTAILMMASELDSKSDLFELTELIQLLEQKRLDVLNSEEYPMQERAGIYRTKLVFLGIKKTISISFEKLYFKTKQTFYNVKLL